MLTKLKTTLFTLITLLTLFSGTAFAQVPDELRKREGTTPCSDDQVYTAIGCITTTADARTGFVSSIMRFAVGISGAVALILLLYGFFQLSISQGNPDKVKQGKEIITSAIAGLIFVTMSVVLMGFIGINILGIPGLQ